MLFSTFLVYFALALGAVAAPVESSALEARKTTIVDDPCRDDALVPRDSTDRIVEVGICNTPLIGRSN
jgi:hypothetical protein